MLRSLLTICIAVATTAVSTASGGTAQDESVSTLCRYISIDTTNPPGNEKCGAVFLADILRKNGIAAEIFDTAPGRACVYARLAGTGKKRPLILLNHIDVVPASAQDWDHPPLQGQVINGEIWGRGAVDMKSMGIAELMALLSIKRSGMAHDRDIIFLATPDEEASGRYGAGWFTKNHPQLVKDAEFLLNEGAFIETAADGKPRFWGVDVGEKSALWLKVAAQGDAGHASMPIAQSAPNRLVRALSRLIDNPPAPRVIPPVKTFFETTADQQEEPLRSYYKNIAVSITQPAAYAELLKMRWASSMLRDTVSLTVMKSGYKTNVIPAEATAEIDCRLLPGTDKDRLIRELEQTLADPSLKISVLSFDEANASSTDTELFKAIQDVAAQSGPTQAPVVPVIPPWFTDSHWFRNLGTVSYGFAPFKIDDQHLATMHGKNERLPVDTYLDGVKILTAVVEKVSR
jgi:acetylornithine deacetylase/succinyl-diaminopimelate desuccinylase-like protein